VILLTACVYATPKHQHKQSHHAIKINSHGILTDLDFPNDKYPHKPYKINQEADAQEVFWQCFPREGLMIELDDLGNSAEELEPGDTYSLITISVTDAKGVDHEYSSRRAWPVVSNMARFQTWEALLKKEKYVCLAGNSPMLMNDSQHKGKDKVVVWYWEMLKTKKGCDSYFANMCQSKLLAKKKPTA